MVDCLDYPRAIERGCRLPARPPFMKELLQAAAIVLAKDICETFAKVSGLPEALFQAIKAL
jgi:hypothetical protein